MRNFREWRLDELLRTPLLRSSVNRGRGVGPSRAALLAHHQHGAVGMPHNRIRDAAQQDSPHTVAAPAAHNYQPYPYLFAKCDYLCLTG